MDRLLEALERRLAEPAEDVLEAWRRRAHALVAAGQRVVVARGGLGFDGVMALASAAHPSWRASEQLELGEQTVWEMLHQSRLAMTPFVAPDATSRRISSSRVVSGMSAPGRDGMPEGAAGGGL